jgi:hypothetical protein
MNEYVIFFVFDWFPDSINEARELTKHLSDN